MSIDIPDKKSRTEIIQSGIFKDEDKIVCDYHNSIQFSNWSQHEDSTHYAMANLGLIEDAIELIAQTSDNSLVTHMKNNNMLDDVDWSDKESIKNILIVRIKKNWDDLHEMELMELEHIMYDKILSEFGISITLETTYGSLKHLDGDTIEKWEYTVFTQYGEFDV
jgi:hypothetical protein